MTALENQLDIMMAESLDPSNPTDREVAERLRELLGDFFAEKVFGDSNWARAILGVEDQG
jgi:transcription initiation factor TFIID subunit 6